MSNAIIEKLFLAGSPLVVLVAVVYAFLKFLSLESRKTNALFKQMHEEHILARREAIGAIRDNTLATTEHASALKDLSIAIGSYTISLKTRERRL